MLKITSLLAALAVTLALAPAAHATPPQGNFSVFYIQNPSNSGISNANFCVSVAHSVLAQNGFTNLGSSSVEAWGDNGNTLVVVGCVAQGNNSPSAGVQLVAVGPDYTTTENWRNLIRAQMINFFVTL